MYLQIKNVFADIALASCLVDSENRVAKNGPIDTTIFIVLRILFQSCELI
jgi:hypothetical protein